MTRAMRGGDMHARARDARVARVGSERARDGSDRTRVRTANWREFASIEHGVVSIAHRSARSVTPLCSAPAPAINERQNQQRATREARTGAQVGQRTAHREILEPRTRRGGVWLLWNLVVMRGAYHDLYEKATTCEAVCGLRGDNK